MTSVRKYIVLSLLLLVQISFLQLSSAQKVTISPDIVKSFKTGNSKLLTAHFNDVVKISILSKEYETGIEEATDIIGKFFSEHPPSNFEIKFESEKKDSKFVIAVLSTKNENYRVNVFFKSAGNKDVIHLLRIEKENESSF